MHHQAQVHHHDPGQLSHILSRPYFIDRRLYKNTLYGSGQSTSPSSSISQAQPNIGMIFGNQKVIKVQTRHEKECAEG